ncbi:MAG: hypothetical protein FJ029_14105 [Actinobacteria bacterium]|nr:hypothetical protein [Actinomycetota bacterium]
MALSDDGPYVTAAVLCERVLRDQDGLFTIVRTLDRIIRNWSGPLPGDSAVPPIDVRATAYVALTAGSARGRATLGLRVVKPSGEILLEKPFPVLFEMDERAAAVAVDLAFPGDQEGLWWIEIRLDGQLATKIPLRLVDQRVSGG